MTFHLQKNAVGIYYERGGRYGNSLNAREDTEGTFSPPNRVGLFVGIKARNK